MSFTNSINLKFVRQLGYLFFKPTIFLPCVCVQSVKLNVNIARQLLSFTYACDSCWCQIYEQFYIVPFLYIFLLIWNMFDLVYPKMLINALINKHVLTCS